MSILPIAGRRWLRSWIIVGDAIGLLFLVKHNGLYYWKFSSKCTVTARLGYRTPRVLPNLSRIKHFLGHSVAQWASHDECSLAGVLHVGVAGCLENRISLLII